MLDSYWVLQGINLTAAMLVDAGTAAAPAAGAGLDSHCYVKCMQRSCRAPRDGAQDDEPDDFSFAIQHNGK
jgi:hypothetical protein